MSSTVTAALTDLFQKSSCGKKLKCLICNCWLPSMAESFVNSHLGGRKHKLQLEKRDRQNHIMKSSVYVKGFDPHLDDLESKLTEYFMAFAVAVKDIYIDKNQASYAIIEVENEGEVEKVVSEKREKFHGRKLIVRRREVSKQKSTLANEEQESSSSSLAQATCMLPKELQDVLNLLNDLSKEMEALMKHYQLSHADLELRKLLCELLKNVLEEIHPNCELKVFGSSANGLGVTGSDVDMTLLTADTVENELEVMEEVREVIQRFAPGCKNVSLVSTKTCPIIKFVHSDSSLHVDLSLNNRIACANTRLLKSYMNCDSRLLPLVFTLRTWTKMHGLTGRSTYQVTNYSLTVMVVYFLQHLDPPVLPCLQDVDTSIEPVIINDWNCTFQENTLPNHSLNKLSVGELLHGFFKFYCDFDYENQCVTIQTLKIMNRKDCKLAAHANGMPIDDINIDTVLVVQDPFKLNHNVAQNLSQNGLIEFKDKLSHVTQLFADNKDHISLVSMFTLKLGKKKRARQKQKCNRTHFYTISLPHCFHVTGCDNSPNCYQCTKKLLVEELKMTLVEENVACETFSLVASDKVQSGADDTTMEETLVTKVDRGSVKRKFNVENNENKKIKLDHEKVEFLVSVTTDTWTNRRKHRRTAQLRSENAEILADTSKSSCVDLKLADAQGNADSERQENDKTSSHDSSKLLFQFKAVLEKARTEKDTCKIFLEMLDDTQNIQHFQTFYAFIKKELINVFKMNFKLLIILSWLQCAQSIWWWFSNDGDLKSSNHESEDHNHDTTAVAQIFAPFEISVGEQKFLAEAKHYLQNLPMLDQCNLLIINRLKTSCNKLSDEQLSKLSVNLLNCQSAVEGRPTFKCSDDMELIECTKGMDSDVWNSYHIISNRARAICHSIRQAEFRMKTERTVNHLASATLENVNMLKTLASGQKQLKEAADEALETISTNQNNLMAKQDEFSSKQNSFSEMMNGNIDDLIKEKRIIAQRHKQVEEYTHMINYQLASLVKEIKSQDLAKKESEKEILKDLDTVKLKADEVLDKLEGAFVDMDAYHDNLESKQNKTLKNLQEIQETIEFMNNVLSKLYTSLHDQLPWLHEMFGGTMDRLTMITVILAHVLFFIGAFFAVVFFNAPVVTRYSMVVIVPLNCMASLHQYHKLTYLQMSWILFLTIPANFVVKKVWNSFLTIFGCRSKAVCLRAGTEIVSNVTRRSVSRDLTETLSAMDPREETTISSSFQDKMTVVSTPEKRLLPDEVQNFTEAITIQFSEMREAKIMPTSPNVIDQSFTPVSKKRKSFTSSFTTSPCLDTTPGGSARCSSFTRAGMKCRNSAVGGNNTCRVHTPKK